MNTTALQKVEAESHDMVPHADRTSYYNLDGARYSPPADEIAQVAYNRFVEQGSIHGHDMEHWLNAEILLRARHDQTLANQPWQVSRRRSSR